MATMMAVPVGQYQQQMCIQCNAKPRYFDGVKLHDFCGKMCAGNFAAAGGGQGMMQAPMMGMATNAGQFQQQQQQPPPSQMQVQMQPAPAGMPQYPPQMMPQNQTQQQQIPMSPQQMSPQITGSPNGMQQPQQQPMMQPAPIQMQQVQPPQQMQPMQSAQPMQSMQPMQQPMQSMQQPMQSMQQPMQPMQSMQPMPMQPMPMQPMQPMQMAPMPMQPMPMQPMPMQPMPMQPMPMMMPWGPPPGMPPMPGMCATPGCGKPVFFDATKNVASMYCGRNHMQQAKATGQFISTAPPQAPSFFPPLQAPPQAGPPQMTPQQKAAAGLCQLPNCSAPVWVDARGSRSQYCGKKHMNQAQGGGGGAAAGPSTYGAPGPSAPLAALVNPCLICKNREQWQGSMFCGRGCLKKAQAQAPSLLEIPTTHPKFKDVENQFTSKWVGSPVPTVKAVYMVMTSESDMKKFEAYRDKIEAKNNHKSRGREPGNQQRRWHGTTRVCKLGEPGNSTLCTNTTCALCNIIRSSFDMKYASRGLFGIGIYTSATPSKSNGYISVAPGSTMRPVLLNKVVVGKGYNVNVISSQLTAPPAGFDSVLGQLAADELIVYTNDAIRPAYLIMFA